MDKWPAGIDPHGNGIRVRVYRHGKCVYNKTLQGDPYNAGDLAAAVKHRETIKSRVTLGLPIVEGEKTRTALFSEVAADFLMTLQVKYSTALHYENILNREWMPLFGNMLISEITTADIKKHVAARKVVVKTKKNMLIPLSCVFRHAIDNCYRTDNPVFGIKVGKSQKPPVERFTPAERTKILAGLEGQARLYFSLMFATGMRPGELLGMKWIDWDGEQIHVRRQITERRIENTTKTHERRRVYVPKWARSLLTNAPTRFTGEWVFQKLDHDHYKDTETLNEQWHAALKSARLEYRVPYAARHTRAAELLSTGVKPGDAAKQLGHTLEMFFRTYAEFIEEFCEQISLERFEGFDEAGSAK